RPATSRYPDRLSAVSEAGVQESEDDGTSPLPSLRIDCSQMAHRNSDMYSMKKSFPAAPRHTAATPAPADIAESAGFLSYWLRAAEPVPGHKKTVLRVCASMPESAEPAEQLLRPPPHFLWHRNASPGKVKSPRETTGNTHGPRAPVESGDTDAAC